MSWQLAVLGPVELMSDGVPIPPMPPKQQAALVMLACARGRTVSVEELVDGIWGADRPSSAVGALRNYAWSLRKHLSAQESVLLSSESRGYRLDGPMELDIDAVDRLRAEVNAARAGGCLDTADRALRTALGAWRGDPLTGVPGPWAAAERARLRRLHRVLEEDLIEITVQRGDFSHAMADLEALITGDPHSERLRGLMMTALYRAGRRTEALDEYQRIRKLLVSEQGIEPGPALAELHRQILSDEMPAAEAPTTPITVVAPRPAQLPPDTADFTGREELVRELCGVLGASRTIVAISGMGGVGKTALALHVAHRIRDIYPDGQLYVDLFGAGATPAEPGHVLGAFLRALGVAQKEIPVGLAERAALFRSAISGRRMLMVLDNASDAAQVAPLLPGESSCAVLITARRPLTALPGVRSAALEVLEPEEAVTLFTRIVGSARVSAEPEAARRIVELCGLLPMAVRIVAARVAARPRWTVVSEADRLAAERHDLDRFRVGDLALTAAFRAGYEQLPLDAARAFRLLAVADLPDLSLAATAAVLDTVESVAEDLCEELVDRGMLESVGRGRYHYHDLMRLFALGCPDREHEPDVTARLLDYYLATMKTVLRVRHPGLRLRLAATGHPGTRLSDLDSTRDFLAIERRNLAAVYRLAIAGSPRHRVLAADLALTVAETGLACDATVDLVKVLEELVRAIESDGDIVVARRARLALVFALAAELEQPLEAAVHVRGLLADDDPDIDPWTSGAIQGFAGMLALHDGDPARATAHFATALTYYRRADSSECVRVAYSLLARAYSAAGRNRDSLAAAARAVVGDDQSGVRRNIVWGLTEAAWILSREGDADRSTRLFEAALVTARRFGNTRFESAIHARAARAHLDAGHFAQAVEHAELAESTRISSGSASHSHNLLVRYTALRRLGRTLDAAECYRTATTQIPDFDTALTAWTPESQVRAGR
ncbi:BTAD domain-containing putative transcriptional regulator [Nocardia sp. CDC153]|uniref:AfsR/SARP family transcriptional regulator n=1 Tax=Nocardia sp. CDC153 TaxID=3112167 RepID=UPI002DC03E62|nr:BTAD domain-containing putative transcriptional regulator [Nocardia sp. CDC153]MEC3954209.1 BTAD domain-containing putative transcriptional regulator [Nocardia sp. CDC153]